MFLSGLMGKDKAASGSGRPGSANTAVTNGNANFDALKRQMMQMMMSRGPAPTGGASNGLAGSPATIGGGLGMLAGAVGNRMMPGGAPQPNQPSAQPGMPQQNPNMMRGGMPLPGGGMPNPQLLQQQMATMKKAQQGKFPPAPAGGQVSPLAGLMNFMTGNRNGGLR